MPTSELPQTSAWRRILGEHYRIIMGNRLSAVGFVFIVLFLVVAIFAPWLAPHDPWEMLYDQEGEFASLHP